MKRTECDKDLRRWEKDVCKNILFNITFVQAMYIPAVINLCFTCWTLYTCKISFPPYSTSFNTWQCSKKSTGKWGELDVLMRTFFFDFRGLIGLRDATALTKRSWFSFYVNNDNLHTSLVYSSETMVNLYKPTLNHKLIPSSNLNLNPYLTLISDLSLQQP